MKFRYRDFMDKLLSTYSNSRKKLKKLTVFNDNYIIYLYYKLYYPQGERAPGGKQQTY
jgi:hypothetical protein